LWILSIQSCSITILRYQAIHEFAKFLKSKYGYEIPFKGAREDDFLDFQTSIRKSKATDPLHKWVNTYNQFLWNLKPLYKYIYYPNEEPKNRQLPEFLIGLNQLHRKEGTTYRIDLLVVRKWL
jgi:hypothetical protein